MADQLKRELPFDIAAPGEELPAAQEPAGDGKIPGYAEPYQRCANCEHFDGEGTCNLYKLPADMDGYCPRFEEGESAEEDAREGGEANEYGEDE